MVSSVLPVLGVLPALVAEFEDEARALDVRDRDLLAALAVGDADAPPADALEGADDDAPAFPRAGGLGRAPGRAKFQSGPAPGEPVEIALVAQRALEAGRADFEVVRVGN